MSHLGATRFADWPVGLRQHRLNPQLAIRGLRGVHEHRR